MERIYEIFGLWYIKAFFGFILSLFASVKISIIIVFIMILLDTLTGTICAVRAKRFNSRSFRKNISKILIYSICILTIRLMEIGALQNITTMLTQVTAGFLIITEAISILENLTILGLPISLNLLYIIYKQFRTGMLEEVLTKNQEEKRELGDIEDMLYLQIPSIKSEKLRKMLEVKFEVWIRVLKDINYYLHGLKKSDNEIIYYKVMSIIQTGIKDIQQGWIDEKIPNDCIEQFNKWNDQRNDEWFSDIKEICFRISSPSKKKDEIIKKITILLYQTVLDSQKLEKEFCLDKNNP